MSEQGSSPEPPRPFVLDTSVAVKFYVPEELREEALEVLGAAEAGYLELVAPATLQLEFLNALWWKYRRGELSKDEVQNSWERLIADRPASLYAPEDLMPRAGFLGARRNCIRWDHARLPALPLTTKRRSSVTPQISKSTEAMYSER